MATVLRQTRIINQSYLRPLDGNSDEILRDGFLGTADVNISGTASHSQPVQTHAASGLYLISGTAGHEQEPQTSDGAALQIFAGTGDHSQPAQNQTGAALQIYAAEGDHEQPAQDQDGEGFYGTLILGAAIHAQEAQSQDGIGQAGEQPQVIPLYRLRQVISGTGETRQAAQSQKGKGTAAMPVTGTASHRQEFMPVRGRGIYAIVGHADHLPRAQYQAAASRIVTAEDELIEILAMLEVA